MKFKIGDKVRVKSFKEIMKNAHSERTNGVYEFVYGSDDNLILFCSPMENFCEKVYVISDACNDDTYLLEEDDDEFWWLESWLDPVTIEVINFDNIE